MADLPKIIIIEDYIASLQGYEREIASRYLAGEELATIAAAHNVSVDDLRRDLRACLEPLRHL